MNQPLQPIALPHSWFARPSPEVAPAAIGCTLVRHFPDGQTLRGLIVETEAYAPDDPACHAYRRRTPRNAVMFGAAGRTYVYLIYGMYHCLNLVTDGDGVASAVLIRALQLETLPPWIAATTIAKRQRVAAGPGKLCLALNIDRSLNDRPLQPDSPLWLEPRSAEFQQQLESGGLTLTQTTRIGLKEGVDFPWRWYLTACPAVSKR